MNLPAFTPETDWVAPSLSELPSWANAKRVCVDIETCDPTLKKYGPGVRTNGYITGVGFAIEDGPAFYLPVRHYGGGNLDEEKVFQYLRDQAAAYDGPIVGANLQYDMDYLAERGVLYRGTYRDVQVAEPLLDELQMSYSLDNIAARRGLAGKDEKFLREFAECWGVNPKSGMWQLPAKAVGRYAEQDVRLPLKLLRLQEREIERQDLWPIYEVECKLQKVLLKMKRRGVRIDFDKLDQIDKLSIAKEQAALDEIHRLTGRRLVMDHTGEKVTSEITRTGSLVPIFQGLGIPIPRTDPTPKFPTGQDSVKNEWLDTLDHPVCAVIREARKWNKLRTTFVASIHTHSVGDRIHCTFNQMIGEDDSGNDTDGARYGRLSCKNPNLQQQPARDPEIGPLWRSIYLPDEGGQWACLDYSQQEPRWLVHYAETVALDPTAGWSKKARKAAIAAAEAYRTNPKTDNHQMMADLCGVARKPAKELFLGKIYGMGGGKLARKLGLPTISRIHSKSGYEYEAAGPEAQAIIDQFNEGVPFVSLLSKMTEESAGRKGFILTAGGRRCRFPEKSRGRYDWLHKALNRLIQGSSGDQTKKAMVDADDAGCRIQLQVHDELNQTFWDKKENELLEQVMLQALPCRVPHLVDVECGPSWGEVS